MKKSKGSKYWNAIFEKDVKFSPLADDLLDDILCDIESWRSNSRCDCIDIGCGRGELVLNLLKRGFWVTAIDFSEVALQITRKMALNNDSDLSTKLSTKRMDINSLEPESLAFENKFDLIFVNNVIAFIENKNRFFKFVRNNLKDGGKCIIHSAIRYENVSVSDSLMNTSIPFNYLFDILKDNFGTIKTIHTRRLKRDGAIITLMVY